MKGPNDLCPICFNKGYTKNLLGEESSCSNGCQVTIKGWLPKKEPEKVEAPPPSPPIPALPSLGPAKEAVSQPIYLDYNQLPIIYEITPPAKFGCQGPYGDSFYIEEFWLWWPCLEQAPIEISIEVDYINLFKGHAAVFLMGPVKLAVAISQFTPIRITFKKAAEYNLSVPNLHGAVVMRGMYKTSQPYFGEPCPSPAPSQWYTIGGGPPQNGWVPRIPNGPRFK